MSQLNQSIVESIYKYYSYYRASQCLGCVYNYLSQRDHTCANTDFDPCYFKDTLQHFEELDVINSDDVHLVSAILVFIICSN